MERFRMFKAQLKRLREEQESMDARVDVTLTLSEDMNCSPQVPRPTKRACAGNVRRLKEEDHIPANTCIPTAEVSKLDPPPLKVDFGAAEELRSNASGGFGQEGQDYKEEEIPRRDYRDVITGEAKDGLLNDDEVNGQEKKTDSHLEARRQPKNYKSFEERIEELKAFKAKHGHVHVTVKHDKSLALFCTNMRNARRGTRRRGPVITEDRIKALDELGFAWDKNKSFEERIEELKAFKEKHGHVCVPEKHDKSLANFCKNMRSARRGTKPGKVITEVRVTVKHDKSLALLCTNMRGARRGTRTGPVITEDRIKALDELGFAWDKNKSFEERIEDLKAFKEKHGHIRVTEKHDKSLSNFCKNMRSARRGTKQGKVITEDRIKALDELGFEWGHQEIK